MDPTAARRFARVALALVAVTAVASPPAQAADPVASVADVTLPAVPYSHVDQTSSGTMTLTIDSSTNPEGWHVTIVASPFVYSGANSGSNLPAANLALTSAADPLMTSGQAIDATGGPMVPAVDPVGTLDVARTTVTAQAGFGQGTYTQDLGVSLAIPGGSAAGTYSSTLTVTAAVGP